MPPVVNKALLIDDSDIDLFIQKRFLEVSEFASELITFQSASDALDFLRKTPTSEVPEIIFLDLNMPDIDGFAFLEQYEKFPEEVKSKINVVVLTSSNNKRDKSQSMSSKHVIKFITKPLKKVDIEELKGMLKGRSLV